MLLKTTRVTWQTGNSLTVGVILTFGLRNGFTGHKSLKTPEENMKTPQHFTFISLSGVCNQVTNMNRGVR